MHTRTRHRSTLYWTWIACLAILFNAFAPVLSHAMGTQAETGASVMLEMEVCTALGMEMRQVASSSPSDPSDPSDAGKLQKNTSHCAWCAAHAASHGLPPPMPAGFVPAAGRTAWPPLYYQSSRTLFPWALAQPRAPPSLS